MNESDFEESLRAIRPTAPSPGLVERVRKELAGPAAVEASAVRPRAEDFGRWVRNILALRWVRDCGWACAGAAAAVVLLAIFHRQNAPAARLVAASPPMAESDAFEHEETTRELLSAEDSTELFETADGPARQVRYSYREHHAWANPKTGARVELEVPREDVFFLPVSMQ